MKFYIKDKWLFSLVVFLLCSCTAISPYQRGNSIDNKTDFHIYLEKKTGLENPKLVKYIKHSKKDLKVITLFSNMNNTLLFINEKDKGTEISFKYDTIKTPEEIFIVDSSRIGESLYLNTIVKPEYQSNYLGINCNNKFSIKISSIKFNSREIVTELDNTYFDSFYNFSIYSNCYHVRMPEVFYDHKFNVYYIYISGKPINTSLESSFTEKNKCNPSYNAKIIIRDGIVIGTIYADNTSMLKVSGEIYKYADF